MEIGNKYSVVENTSRGEKLQNCLGTTSIEIVGLDVLIYSKFIE